MTVLLFLLKVSSRHSYFFDDGLHLIAQTSGGEVSPRKMLVQSSLPV